MENKPTREALEQELWNMLPDDCKAILLPLKKTYIESLMADIDSYCQGKKLPGPVWVKASERLPVKDGYYCFKANGGYMGAYLRTASNGSRWLCDSAGGTIRSWKQCEWLDESPAEQLVADNARSELSLVLYRLLKAFKGNQMTKQQEKYYSQAEAMLKKHSKITDILRTEAPEQPVREVEFAEWISEQGYWPVSKDQWMKSHFENNKTTAQLYDLFKQKLESGEKEDKK